MSARRGPFPHGNELWRVRVRARADPVGILGAGVLLDREHVLTCAHVALAAAELAVDMVGLEGIPHSDARIVACVPPFADERRGDVALLRLDVPQPHGIGARLRRAALTWDRPVRALGYPDERDLDIGVWARMTLAGRVGFEWLQMNRRSDGEQRVRAGFSGAGVADERTGEVLGIVVSEYTADAAGLSWMLPVEAIITHLPLVSEWAVGDSGIDPGFAAPVREVDRGRAAEVADWLARRHEGAAVLIVPAPDLPAVRQAVALSNPNAPDLGPVDLALDVGGRTVKEVWRRIMDRAALAGNGGMPPMTIVVVGLDEAEEPEALLGEVFRPLVGSGARLVLAFRHKDSASLELARTLVTETVTGRLDAAATRIAALPLGGLGDQVTELRLRLTMLRRAATEDAALVAGRLASFERLIARTEQHLANLDRDTASISADRGWLEAERARAIAGGLIEHPGLAAKYREVLELLAAEPVDAAAVHAAVRAYRDAVRQELANREKT